jgi:hypothetical protein
MQREYRQAVQGSQDFSKNTKAIESSFNELQTTLLRAIVLNPMLFDDGLSCLENQLQLNLQWVDHTIQAAIQHCFAVDYLNLKELTMLFWKLEKRADKAG